MCQIGNEPVLEFTFIYWGGGCQVKSSLVLKRTDKQTDHAIIFYYNTCTTSTLAPGVQSISFGSGIILFKIFNYQ